MNKTIEALFYNLIEGAEGLYKPLLFGKDDEQMEKAYKEMGLTIEQQNELYDIFGDCSCMAERHGFEQGLKLGLKLAFAACGDEGKGT